MVAYVVILAALLLIAIVAGRVAEREEARCNMERCGVSTRNELSLDKIYMTHYGKDGIDFERFTKAWRTIADRCDILIGRLRPGDRIEVELVHARDEIGWLIWERLILPKRKAQEDIHVACVDDLLRLLCMASMNKGVQ